MMNPSNDRKPKVWSASTLDVHRLMLTTTEEAVTTVVTGVSLGEVIGCVKLCLVLVS